MCYNYMVIIALKVYFFFNIDLTTLQKFNVFPSRSVSITTTLRYQMGKKNGERAFILRGIHLCH